MIPRSKSPESFRRRHGVTSNVLLRWVPDENHFAPFAISDRESPLRPNHSNCRRGPYAL